jgi:hypothetical protein
MSPVDGKFRSVMTADKNKSNFSIGLGLGKKSLFFRNIASKIFEELL